MMSAAMALAIGIGIQNFPEGAAISLPLMPLFGIGMTKLGPRWNGDAFPGLCRRLGLCGWIRNTFPGMLRTMVRLAAFHIAGAATGTDFDDRTGVQQ